MEYKRMLDEIPGGEYVILDLSQGVRQYLIATRTLNIPGPTLNNILSEMMLYVMELRTAECGLEAYIEGLLEECDEFGSEKTGMLVGAALRRIGVSIIHQCVANRLYNEDGLLFYRFYGWADPISPMFEKYIELDAFSD